MQDEDLVVLNVNQKLDRILDNQRFLFKLVSDLLRETRAVNSGDGMGGSSQSIDYVERVDFVQSFSGSPRSNGRASSGRDTGNRENCFRRSATNLSLAHDGGLTSFQTSSFVGEEGDMEGEEGDSFLQEAVKLNSNSSSGILARKVVQAVFQPEELENRNCSGARGKELLDQIKLGVAKKCVFKLYPCVQTKQAAQWR